jgi:AcrR family transcriptional regulator
MAEAYKSSRRTGVRRDLPPPPGTPAATRELRAQGRKTMRKLLDAGMRVFADRGFYAARVDDIVRSARTSHGTFYLYFANKEELLRALAVECAHEMGSLAGALGVVTVDEAGVAELRRFVESFFSTYARFGPVLRAWMEGNVEDRETSRLGVAAFTDIASALAVRMREAGARSDPATVAALMAMLERFAYFRVSRRLDFEAGTLYDTVAGVIYRGFFSGPIAA